MLCLMTTTTTRHQVATNVELARRVRGLSKTALAAGLDMSPSTFRGKMRGETAFDSDDLAALAALLDVEPGEFFAPSIMPSLAA